MKKMLTSIAALMLLVASLGSAWAIPMTTVGGLDTLLFYADLGNSDPVGELAWTKQVLNNNSLTFEYKSDNNSGWISVDNQQGVYAQSLTQNPAYYIVKTGNKSNLANPSPTHFLFSNIGLLEWAVVDLGKMGFDVSKVDYLKISHTTTFNGQNPPPPVPEPGTLLLLGSGLAGLAWYSRKRKQG